MKPRWLPAALTGAVLIVTWARQADAQPRSSLPAPSRTAFKCVISGHVSYSDAPCPDAQRVELQPTRGLDRSSGKTMTGPDVRNERFREQLADAIQPVTGLTPAQIEVQRRRVNLPGAAKIECAKLDRDLPAAERAEAAMPRGARTEQAAHDLLIARQRYRALSC